jgi:hypothetical protein
MRSLGTLRKRRVKQPLGEAELHNGRRHAGAKISCEMSPMRKGLNRTNTVSREWLAGIGLMFEQLFRFLNFGEILSRIEIDKDWCEHL